MGKPFEILTVDELKQKLKGRRYRFAQVHHTWKPNHSMFTGRNHIALQEGMYNYHTKTRGWDDIGQHVTLMPDGLFVTGRAFNSTPAGIKGYNTNAFMVEMVGDFDKGKDKLEGEQLESALDLYNFLETECGAQIMFHNEHAAKTCPGTGINKQEFLRMVREFEKEVAKVAEVDRSKLPVTKDLVKEWEEATENGYVDGSRPQDYVTREEAATMLNRIRRNFRKYVDTPQDKKIAALEKRIAELEKKVK